MATTDRLTGFDKPHLREPVLTQTGHRILHDATQPLSRTRFDIDNSMQVNDARTHSDNNRVCCVN